MFLKHLLSFAKMNIKIEKLLGNPVSKTGRRMAHHHPFYFRLLIKPIADWLLFSRANFLFSLMT